MSSRAPGEDERIGRIRDLVESAKSQTARANREVLLDSRSRTSEATGEPVHEKWSGGASSSPPMAQFPGYDLIREIHRGGQGVVYEAFQRSTRRRVAIKVMREGPFAGEADRVRFDREVRLLARLSHPNIVSIYDSGRVAGHDYFVMDFVDGPTLDRFVLDGARKAAGDDPLPDVAFVQRLFIKVCDGVNAAHLRGVIHRDLKAGNVLVDALGEPRILDFGLAKQGDAAEERTAPPTTTGQFVGSLPWTSPEQTRGTSVDVRTDVYALGVMLYHCLTGRFPYAVDGSPADTMESIRQQAPRSLRSLRPGINRDIETVVLKCLAKDRERRYQSAGELGRDLRRALRGEAVEARRDSAIYVLGKALRRHWVATAGTVGVIGLIAVFAVAMAIQSRQTARERDRAEMQRQRAERAAAFLESMFAGIARDGASASEVDIPTFLDNGARRIESELGDWPEEAAALHETLGETYDKLGYFGQAETHLRRSLELRRALLGGDHPLVYQALSKLAVAVFNKQDLSVAEPLLREAVSLGERILGPEDPELVGVATQLGSLLAQKGEYEEAEAIARRSLAVSEERFGPDHTNVVGARWLLARTLGETGRHQEALSLLQQNATVIEQTRGVDNPYFEANCMVLAEVHERLGDLDTAEQLLRQVVESRRKRIGEEHPGLAWNLYCLARFLYRHRNDLAQAEPLTRKALAIQRSRKGREHPDSADCAVLLAQILMAGGNYAEAELLLRETLQGPWSGWPADRELARGLLAECLEAAGKTDEAERVRRDSE